MQEQLPPLVTHIRQPAEVRTAQDGATHAQILNKLLPSHGITLWVKKHYFQVGRQHRVIWRKGGSARSEVQYLPQVISRMRWRRNKPADKETRSTKNCACMGGGWNSTLFVKGHSFEGWAQYEVKSGAGLEGLAGITTWLYDVDWLQEIAFFCPGLQADIKTRLIYFSHQFALFFLHLFITMLSVNSIFTMKCDRFTYH